MSEIKSPYDLELHETTVDEKWEVTRVPGGWIYRDRVDFHRVAVFVPDYPEPEKEKEEIDPEDQAFRDSLIHYINSTLAGKGNDTEGNRLIRVLLRKVNVEREIESDDDLAHAHS